MHYYSICIYLDAKYLFMRLLFPKKLLLSLLLALPCTATIVAQVPERLQASFPKQTTFYNNISYANDTLKRHQLDIYLPPNAGTKTPLIVWIHGGAWMMGNRFNDMSYMGNTIKGFLDSGYALATIEYRYSTDAVFPAPLQDCNQALEFLYQHASEYKLDKNRIGLIGFSAGGHLASLMALSGNNAVKAFYPNAQKPHFKIKCVLDFYGPSDFITLGSNPDTSINNNRSSLSILLGAMPLQRPDIARQASPSTYVDKNDPPFFIVQGEKDESVPYTQSQMLSAWLTVAGVPNQLTIVPGAPHYGVMFDAADIRKNLFAFLAKHLK